MIPIIAGIIILFALMIIFTKGYFKIPTDMAQVFDNMKSATGVDLKAIADANTIDAKLIRMLLLKEQFLLKMQLKSLN